MKMATFRILFIFLICNSYYLAADDEEFIDLIDHDIEYSKNRNIDSTSWDRIKPYLLPYSHPVRAKLDRIFSKDRVLQDSNTLLQAGFNTAKQQKRTNVIVSTHKDIPKFIFKLYLDDQTFEHKLIEWKGMLKRTKGAKVIRHYINTQGKQSLFIAPHKWLYPVPSKPKPKTNKSDQKNFILVEELIDILPDEENFAKWKDSRVITIPLLDEVFSLVTAVQFNDGMSPDNLPLCKDGRIAFIDTSRVGVLPVNYPGLTKHLPRSLRAYWQNKIANP